MGFGACGQNVALSAASGAPPGAPPGVAARTTGLVQAVALTAAPLPLQVPALAEPSGSVDVASLVFPLRYYFEVEVLEVLEQRSSKTLALGFAWPLCVPEPLPAPPVPASEAAAPTPEAAVPTWVVSGRLPENASALPRSFVVGGDLPKVHLAGKELGKVSGWRPILDVGAGAVLGALLEVDVSTCRLTIFQNSELRFTTEASLPEGWTGAPYGIVDVCGTVRRVQLRQGALPPSQEASAAAAAVLAATDGAEATAGGDAQPAEAGGNEAAP